MHWNEISNLLRCKVERVLEAVSGFTNPVTSSFEDHELYFLSFGVPAKPGIAKDLIEANDIGRKAFADLVYSLLVEKEACEVNKKLANFTKQNQPDESLNERLWLAWPSFYWT